MPSIKTLQRPGCLVERCLARGDPRCEFRRIEHDRERRRRSDEGGGEIVYYETGSGGAVYSVGSITYNASILVDPHISRITANVITRFLGN